MTHQQDLQVPMLLPAPAQPKTPAQTDRLAYFVRPKSDLQYTCLHTVAGLKLPMLWLTPHDIDSKGPGARLSQTKWQKPYDIV